ncbi:MAG: SDR family oxidoreductase [Alphaproteobacteria bacterium]|nr:MAG: SDR family oxidoreductase [Alphaproteobacteria bacterium]
MAHVVVTGASTGIGQATVRQLIGAGYEVFGSVRRQEDADRLKAEFGAAFTPLLFDVTDRPAVDQAAQEVRARLTGKTLAGLVNNAGVAVVGPVLEIAPDEMRHQIEINVIGVLNTIQAFAPLLGTEPDLEGPKGKIINMSSVAGKRAMPFMAPYSVSKFSVEALSDSLRRELLLFGIDVIVIGPGAIKTPIWDKAEEIDVEAYAGSPFYEALVKLRDNMLVMGRKGLPPEKVGDLVVTILQKDHPKTRYPIVPNYVADLLAPKFMPARMLDKIVGKALGLLRENGR